MSAVRPCRARGRPDAAVAQPHGRGAEPTTAGIPSSRATIAACDSGAPTSVTTAAARGNSGVQPTLVTLVTSISPGAAEPRRRGQDHPGGALHHTGGPENPVTVPCTGAPSPRASKMSPRRSGVGGPALRVEAADDQRRVRGQRGVPLVCRPPPAHPSRGAVAPCSRSIADRGRTRRRRPRSASRPSRRTRAAPRTPGWSPSARSPGRARPLPSAAPARACAALPG